MALLLWEVSSRTCNTVKQIFQLRKTNRTARNQYKLNLSVPKVSQVSYGEKRLKYYGPKIWNSLPFHIKASENRKLSKRLLKIEMVVTCSCRVPVGIYMFKVNNTNTRTRCETWSKLKIKTLKRRHWRRSGVFIVNFEHISHLVLVFLLSTLSR